MGPAAPQLAIIHTHTPSQPIMAMASRLDGQAMMVVLGQRLPVAAIHIQLALMPQVVINVMRTDRLTP